MGSYLAAVWRCRYFWMALVRMDLRTRYRRSVLGIGWSLLHPILMTAILCTAFHQLFHLPISEYAPFLLAGLCCWNYLIAVTIQGCQTFFQAEPYIRQYPSPLAIFPLRTALGATFHFLLTLGVVLVLVCTLRGVPNFLALLSLVPNVLLLFILGWSLAVLAGFANVFFQDTQHITEVVFQMLFYASPIIYPVARLEGHAIMTFLRFNPVLYFLRLIREPLLEGRVPSPMTYGVVGGCVLLAAGAAVFTLSRLHKRVVFRL